MAKPMREISGALPSALTDAILTATEPLVLRGLVASWPLVKAGLRSQREGIAYQVIEPKAKTVRQVAYADNFAFRRSEPWTH